MIFLALPSWLEYGYPVLKFLKELSCNYRKMPNHDTIPFSCCIKVNLSKEVILLIRKLDNMGV